MDNLSISISELELRTGHFMCMCAGRRGEGGIPEGMLFLWNMNILPYPTLIAGMFNFDCFFFFFFFLEKLIEVNFIFLKLIFT